MVDIPGKKKHQIPFGDDNKKSKCNSGYTNIYIAIELDFVTEL
jgi:hypothetical protein